MNKFIEKLISRLEEESKLAEIDRERYLHGNANHYNYGKAVGYGNGMSTSIEIVNQLAEEYNNGWIPVSSGRLPEESECVLAFVPNNSTKKIIITPYHDIYYWKNGTITHWQPLPYQPKGEQ